MRKVAKAARHIKPETIVIGDTIRVTRKHKDVTVSTVGTVADRQHYTHSTEYLTADGVTILEYFRVTDKTVTVTLLNRPSEILPSLFEMV